MGITAAIATVAVAAGSTAYSINQSNKQKDAAKANIEQQESRQKKLEDDAKARAANEESLAATQAARDAAGKRTRLAAANNQGRSSTILTSPLGITGDAAAPQTGGKTLLGQ